MPSLTRVSATHKARPSWLSRLFIRQPMTLCGLCGLLLLCSLSLAAPWLAPFDPTANDYAILLQPPSWQHWFGTDNLGRDLMSRILWGGRLSLQMSLVGMSVTLIGGSGLGLVTGYYGGWIDSLLMRLVDIWLAFPVLLFLLSMLTVLGPGLTTITIALGISAIPVLGRLVRATVLSIRHNDFVLAAIASGATHRRILLRHILPNLLGILIVYASAGLGGYLLTGAGLSFLGLGAQPPTPEWGAMLRLGTEYLREAWWLSVFPGLAIFLAVISVNLLGDGMRNAFDPR